MPRYEDRVLQAPAQHAQAICGARWIPAGRPYSGSSAASASLCRADATGNTVQRAFDAGPFIPAAPDSPVVRPQRMPQIDDLPLPAQNQIRAHRGELATEPHPEAKRRSLLERLASFGISRQEEVAAAPPPRERRAAHSAPQPAPGQSLPAAAAAQSRACRIWQTRAASAGPAKFRKPPLDTHGRGAYQSRALEEDQLEIPAFLRRQSS